MNSSKENKRQVVVLDGLKFFVSMSNDPCDNCDMYDMCKRRGHLFHICVSLTGVGRCMRRADRNEDKKERD